MVRPPSSGWETFYHINAESTYSASLTLLNIPCISLVEGKKTVYRVKGKSRLLNFLGKAESFASRLFGLELHAGKKCNSCGTCWSNCPEKNIKRNSNGKPRFGFRCLMCMRCIYHCPQKAISPRFSKFIPIKKGYSFSQYLEE